MTEQPTSLAASSAREWRKNNPEKVKSYQVSIRAKHALWAAGWRKANPDKVRAARKKYYLKNRGQTAEKRSWQNARNKIRRKTDPKYKLMRACRDRVRDALWGKVKSAKTLELLGCTIEFLRAHIENQFVPGMTWGNHGVVWELDHILPCAEFHLQHSEEQEVCFHWTNFQPLFVEDNRAKGDKVL